jgi:Polyketide cyclase / dehydrase and lipid transport
MSSVTITAELQVAPDKVWQLIGGFGSLPDWIPFVTQCELTDGGRVRHLTAADQSFIEKLEKYDSEDRSYSYSIAESHFPVTDYLSTLRVTAVDSGHGSRVDWSARFTAEAVGEEEAQGIFKTIFSDGLNALIAHYAGKE